METVTKKTVTNLSTESVSILTQQFTTDENGNEVQVGGNHRRAYSNSEGDRARLVADEPKEIVSEVLAVWGDEPTVKEIDMSEYTPEPTAEEKIAALEAQNAELTEQMATQSAVIDELLTEILPSLMAAE